MSVNTWSNNWKVTVIDGIWYACGDGGQVVRSTDGVNWLQCVTPTINSLFNIHGVTGLIFAVGDAVCKSTDGVNFVAVTIPKWNGPDGKLYNYRCHSVKIVNGVVYIGTDRGDILKSIDGGATWTPMLVSIATIVNGMHWLDEAHGFIAMPGGLRETNNGGITWTNRLQTSAVAMRDIYVGTDAVGFACGDSGLLYKTTDGGLNWTYVNLGVIWNFHDLHFVDSTTGYICTANNYVIKTTDGGATWWNVSPLLSNLLSNWYGVHAKSSTEAVVVGLKVTAYTTDGGAVWTRTNGASAVSSPNSIITPAPTVPAPTIPGKKKP